MSKSKYFHLSDYLTFKYGNFETLPQKLSGNFDLVVCLANSITGVGSMVNLVKSLKSFCRGLFVGGPIRNCGLGKCRGQSFGTDVVGNDAAAELRYDPGQITNRCRDDRYAPLDGIGEDHGNAFEA